MKKIFQLIVVSLLFLGLYACDNKEKSTPKQSELGLVKNFTNSGCKNKNIRSFKAKREQILEKLVLKALENGYVQIMHQNHRDYCKRDNSFIIKTKVEGDKITVIEEVVNGAQPKCMCYYDLGLELGAFEVGRTYTLVLQKEKWTLARLSFVYTSELNQEVIIKKK